MKLRHGTVTTIAARRDSVMVVSMVAQFSPCEEMVIGTGRHRNEDTAERAAEADLKRAIAAHAKKCQKGPHD